MILAMTVLFTLRFASFRGFSTHHAVKEIERKFTVTDKVLAYCHSHSIQRKEVTLTDTYYDNNAYELTRKDMWLRERNNVWELKTPAKETLSSQTMTGIDHYLEIKDAQQICHHIQQQSSGDQSRLFLPESTPLSGRFLESFGYKPFVRLRSNRKRFLLDVPMYKSQQQHNGEKQRVYVDIDNVEYDQQFIPTEFQKSAPLEAFRYRIGEVELVQPIATSDIGACMSSIFTELEINPTPVRGKLLEYIFRFCPTHYKALQQSGQLGSKGI